MSNKPENQTDPGPRARTPEAPPISMDTASNPTPEQSRAKLLDDLAAADAADAPDFADALAVMLSDELDAPVGGPEAGRDPTPEGSAGEPSG